MLATIVLDAYSQSETKLVKAALEENFSPTSASGWSSAGIYCYWNYLTKEILYFGLTIDLHTRFCQHNGLIKGSKDGTKFKEIQNYFETNEKIGFSIMVQSSLSQPSTSLIKKKYKDIWELNKKEFEEIGADGRQSVQYLEGVLINSFKTNKGYFPKWNKMGGSIFGQLRTEDRDWELVNKFTNTNLDRKIGNNSFSTIRELAESNSFNMFEEYLYAMKITPMSPERFDEFCTKMNGFSIWQEILKQGYLEKKLAF